jgi:hypothetical protein
MYTEQQEQERRTAQYKSQLEQELYERKLAEQQKQNEDWLKKQDLAVTFLDRYGMEVGRRGIKHNDSAPLEQIPDILIQAALSTEDRRFYEHFGIDPIGLFRALSVNARSSGVVQGGSSITQQLAKNLFLSNERTLERKIKEAFLALWLEVRLPKRDILKLYLDRAYMGGGMVQQAPFSAAPAARPSVELAPMPNSNLEAPRQQRAEVARLTPGVIAPQMPGRGSAQDSVSPGSLQDRLFRPAPGAHLRIPMSW